MSYIQNIGTIFAENIDTWLRQNTGSDLKKRFLTPEPSASKLPKMTLKMEVGSGLWVTIMCLFYKDRETAGMSDIVDIFFKSVHSKYKVELPDDFVRELEMLISLGYVEEPDEGRFQLSEDGEQAALKLMSVPKRYLVDADGEEETKHVLTQIPTQSTPAPPTPIFTDPDSWLIPARLISHDGTPFLRDDPSITDIVVTLLIDSVERIKDDFKYIETTM
jgi:hypothetical protein